jgi:hypothetical protein
MTDKPDSPLTPAQEDEVRRLLADARHTEPMPPDVVSRMDGVLDDLAAEPSRRAPVVHLAARRRRAASLLVAAAAVVVVGIGIGQVVGTVGTGEDSDSGVSADATREDAPNAAAGDAGADDSKPERKPERDAVTNGIFQSGKLFKLRPDELSQDLTKIQSDAVAGKLAALPTEAGVSGYRSVSRSCRAGDWGSGTFVPVRYGSLPAVVVFRKPLGDVQVAEVYLCGNPEPVRSLTLPAP